MTRPLLGLALGVCLASCASAPPASVPATEEPATPTVAPSSAQLEAPLPEVSAPPLAAPAEPQVAEPAAIDTFVWPRLEGVVALSPAETRSRLIPRVMGRGWTLLVNAPDSLEFYRPADSALSALLFEAPAEPGSRVRLRFRIRPDSAGTRLELTSHLLARDGTLRPFPPRQELLEANLDDLREGLLVLSPAVQP